MTTVIRAAVEAADSTEETADGASDAYSALLARLSRQSVDRHFDAYADVPWDDEQYSIDPTDPRWEAGADEPLTTTDWYRALPQADRARLGLDLVVSKMKLGLQFESVLKRGLLEYALTLPNGDPQFRYAYHEVIEEAQHSLMFQEFVNRSGFDVTGMRPGELAVARTIVALGRRFPSLFFFFVLGGEDPIDHVQRKALRSGEQIHPLLERIMRIHVTEEARHLSFARHYIKRHVPELSRGRRAALGVVAPLILFGMAQMMLMPSRQIVRRHRIPRDVVRAAYSDPAYRADVTESMRKVRQLAEEVGLLGPVHRRLWKALGLLPAGG